MRTRTPTHPHPHTHTHTHTHTHLHGSEVLEDVASVLVERLLVVEPVGAETAERRQLRRETGRQRRDATRAVTQRSTLQASPWTARTRHVLLLTSTSPAPHGEWPGPPLETILWLPMRHCTCCEVVGVWLQGTGRWALAHWALYRLVGDGYGFAGYWREMGMGYCTCWQE